MRVGTKVAIADLDVYSESPDQGLMVGATGRVVHMDGGFVAIKLDLAHVGDAQWYHYPWKFLEHALEVLDESVP